MAKYMKIIFQPTYLICLLKEVMGLSLAESVTIVDKI